VPNVVEYIQTIVYGQNHTAAPVLVNPSRRAPEKRERAI
jgi:hypothetical protein